MTTKNELMTMEIAALGEAGLGLTQEEIAEELGGDIPQYPASKSLPAGALLLRSPAKTRKIRRLKKRSSAWWSGIINPMPIGLCRAMTIHRRTV